MMDCTLAKARSGIGFALALLGALVSAQASATTYLPSIKIGTAALISPTAGNTYYGSSTLSSDGLKTLTNVETPTPTEIVELARALKNDPDLIYQYVHNNIQVSWMYGLQKGALGAEIDKSGTPFDQAELMVALLRQGTSPYTASYVAGTVVLNQTQFYNWTGITNARAACQLLSSGGIPAAVNGSSNVACTSFTATATVSSVQMAHIWVKVTIPGSHTAGCSSSDVCVFDPSYKVYNWKTQIPLSTAMAFTSGAALAAAETGSYTSGTTSGAPWANAFNTTGTGGLNGTLLGYGTNLLNYITSNNLLGAEIEDIIGGGVIAADYSVVRQATLPDADPSPPYTTHFWTPPADQARYNAIPDQYRTTLETQGYVYTYPGPTRTQMFQATFYADETYGRVMSVVTDFTQDGIQNGTNSCLPADRKQCNYYPNKITLELDGQQLAKVPTFTNPPPSSGYTARGLPSDIILSANHPYAASADGTPTTGGDYMDETMDKNVVSITSMTIVTGWGDNSMAVFNKWSDEPVPNSGPTVTTGRAADSELPQMLTDPYCYNDETEFCLGYFLQPAGDFSREKIAAAWLAQVSRAAYLNGNIANAVPAIHHALGFVYADNHLVPTYNQGPTKPVDEVENDSFDRIDVDSAVSFTSRVADSGARDAAVQTFAAASAVLEGSVSGQLLDLPDTVSTATRFEWGNSPPADPDINSHQNPLGLPPQTFYQFTSSTIGAAVNLLTSEGYLYHLSGGGTQCPDYTTETPWNSQPEISQAECVGWGTALDTELTNYASAGFTVVASRDGFLGPGQRGGGIEPIAVPPHLPTQYEHNYSKQRGGAFIATKYDSNNEPIEIAHIVYGQNDTGNYESSLITTKGGGAGGSAPDNHTNYDPSEAADILKARFVDRSNALGVNLSNGSLAYTSPVSLTIGSGGFPYELTGSLTWQPGPSPDTSFGPVSPTEPQPGWKLNWLNRLAVSGSGMEAMGQSDIRAAIGAIVAFYTAQDMYENSAQSVQRDVAAVLVQSWWAHQTVGNVASVSLGADTRQFVQLFNGTWVLPGSGYATLAQTGSRVPYEETCGGYLGHQPYTLTRGWDYSGLSFTVTNQHGDKENFGYWKDTYATNQQGSCGYLKGFRLTSWTFPYGMTITPTYVTNVNGIDNLTQVSNSVGRSLTINLPDTGTTGSIGNGLSGSDARSITLGALDANGNSDSMTDAMSKATTFAYAGPFAYNSTQRPIPYTLLNQVFTPDSPTEANVEYDYDSEGRIDQVLDAVAIQQGTRGPYTFFIGDGTRGERDDPLGQPYTVDYDGYGHPSGYIDEMGYETFASFDSRGRVLQYVYPEGDCQVFAYDSHNNTLDMWTVDKTSACNTGAGSSHVLKVSATYNTTWNKPASVTNARNYKTTFVYYGSGTGASLLETATRPVLTEGTPIYSYVYTASGKLDNVTDADGIVTKHTYDSYDNLTATIVDYNTGSGHLNLTTQFTPDARGDVVTTIDPRTYITTSLYDLDRRKTEDDHHNGTTTSAFLNAAEKVQYDAVGRDIEDDSGLTFSTTGTPSVLTWQMTKKTQYTPTSKVYTVTDADNRITTNTYDDGDRLRSVTDPLSRETLYSYCNSAIANCAANQVRIEYRAYSSGSSCSLAGTLQECYRQISYMPDGEMWHLRDANNNLTVYSYDGFNRLTQTLFPDSTTEQLTLDPNGNVVTRVNRRGEALTYQYNPVDWITQKCRPTNGGDCPASPAETDYWTYFLNGRINTLCDTSTCATTSNTIDYNYDTAGRHNATITHITGFGAWRGMTYTLDANGNRTKLLWSSYDGSYYVGYCYDNLNRMTVAMELSTDSACNTNKLATYAYDPLSRRTSVTYLNGATMAYTYFPSGDLQTLNHNMSGSGDDPHYTFTYTNAHELHTEANSDADYVWQPPANASTTYATANNLNQYPSVNGAPFGYDGDGNLTTDGTWTFNYDAENRLSTANKTAGGTVAATYDYDPLGRRNHKSGTGVTEAYFLNDGDDNVVEYNGSRAVVALYVPGPAIDEPIVMSTPSGSSYTHQYFHTNHQGSVIATSNDSAARASGPFTYDPYGNCFNLTSSCASLGTVPFAFTGQRLDAETGCYYYRARYYCADDLRGGRFLQTDPVGYTADLNLYTYVGNDPVGKTDPTGMDTWSLGFSLNGVVIPGVVSGTGSIYVAVDDKGNVGLFVTGGGGGIGGGKLSVGESLSAGVTAGWSNAQDIHGLQGPFASQTVTVGEGASATGEAFEGSYAGKAVVGGSVTIGAGEGASITSGITGTKELMNGKSPEALRPPSMSLPKGTPGKPSNSPAPRVAHPQQVSQAHSTPGFLTRGQNPNQSHMCTGSNIPTKGPCS